MQLIFVFLHFCLPSTNGSLVMVNDVLLGHFRTGSKTHDSQVTFCGLKSQFIAIEEAAQGGHGTECDIEKQAGPQEELQKDKQPVSDAQLMPVASCASQWCSWEIPPMPLLQRKLLLRLGKTAVQEQQRIRTWPGKMVRKRRKKCCCYCCCCCCKGISAAKKRVKKVEKSLLSKKKGGFRQLTD